MLYSFIALALVEAAIAFPGMANRMLSFALRIKACIMLTT